MQPLKIVKITIKRFKKRFRLIVAMFVLLLLWLMPLAHSRYFGVIGELYNTYITCSKIICWHKYEISFVERASLHFV